MDLLGANRKHPFWKEPGPWHLLIIIPVLCLHPSHRVNVVGLGGIPKRSFCLWNVETLSEPTGQAYSLLEGSVGVKESPSVGTGRQGDVHSWWSPLVFINSLPPLCLHKHSEVNAARFVVLRYFFKKSVYCIVFLVDGVFSSWQVKHQPINNKIRNNTLRESAFYPVQLRVWPWTALPTRLLFLLAVQTACQRRGRLTGWSEIMMKHAYRG